MRSAYVITAWAAAIAALPPATRADEFAVRVLEYAPAPGQFVNDAAFNDPARALGPPTGGGTLSADNSGVVTLGGFGGSITLAFDHTVMDDPRNPFGMDAIVFGNAFYVGGDPQRRLAEPATIEISRDANGNGVADDPWYLIPGSHITDAAARFTQRTWDDDTADPTYPPSQASWIPMGDQGVWTTHGYLLPDDPFGLSTVLVNPLGPGAAAEGAYGYADMSPTLVLGDTDGDNVADDPTLTPRQFYTVPDDPTAVGVTPGSGGGDAFDIAWAIDPATGAPAGLTGFDFIRLTTAVDNVFGQFGEQSAEIDAVADVRPWFAADYNGDGSVDVFDLLAYLDEWFTGGADVNGDGVTDVFDLLAYLDLWFNA